MLNFTKNQQLVLRVFFSNPDKEYYFRELARMLGKEPGVIQRAVNDLVTGGLLLSRPVSNSRFFSINKYHPLYKEYKAIFSKTVGIEGSLRGIIQNIPDIKSAFIYGSISAGKETGESDVDLFIIGNPDEDKLMKDIDSLEKKLAREINYTIYSEKEFKKKRRSKDSFIENLIKRPKILLKGDLNDL